MGEGLCTCAMSAHPHKLTMRMPVSLTPHRTLEPPILTNLLSVAKRLDASALPGWCTWFPSPSQPSSESLHPTPLD